MRREEVGIDLIARDFASREINRVGGSLNTLGGEAQQTTGHVSRLGGMVKTMATGVFLGVGMQAFTAVTSSIGSFGGAVIGMNAQLEKSQLQFETLFKDADRARTHVAMLFEFAKRTPFETGPIIEASRLLQTFGGDALNTEKNLRMIGDAAAGASVDINEVSFWVGRAYAAIKGGQPFGEARMRLQELALLSPKAAQEMEKLQKSGADTTKIWAIMEKELGRFTGSMEKQAGTWDGLISTLADTVKLTLASVFKPVFDTMKSGIQGAINFLSSPGVEGAFKAFGQVVADVFKGLANIIGAAFDAIRLAFAVLKPVLDPVLELVTGFAGAVIEAFNTISEALSVLFGRDDTVRVEENMGRIYDAMDPVSKGAGALADALRPLRNIFDTLADFAGKVFDALSDIGGVISDVLDGSKDLGTALGDIATKFGELWKDWSTVSTTITTAAFDLTTGFINKVLDNLPVVTEGLLTFADSIYDTLTGKGGVIETVAGGISQLAEKFYDWVVKDAIPGITRELPKFGDAVLTWLDTHAEDVGKKMGKWGSQLVTWVVPRIPDLLIELTKFGAAVVTWYQSHFLPEMVLAGLRAGSGFRDSLIDTIFGTKGRHGGTPGVIDKLLQWQREELYPWIGNLVESIFKKGLEIGRSFAKGIHNALASGVEDAINSIIRGLNAFVGTFNDILRALGQKTISPLHYIHIPRMDVGSLEVPRDMLAIIHKGEMVVPAEVAATRPSDTGPAFPRGASLAGATYNITINQTFGPSSVRSEEDIRQIAVATAQRARLIGLQPAYARQVGRSA